jgi:hypothetical protein
MVRSIANARRLVAPLLASLAVAVAGQRAQAQGTATGISGIYNTGLTSSGALQTGGGTDANWSVTYASTNGGSSASTTYEGAAYVITPSVVTSSGYTANTSNAQWIVAPGAHTTTSTSSSVNAGGDNLPGNGNTGSNEGVYVYTLAFTITGTGGNGAVISSSNSQIQITMTLAADDQYSVYVNPTGNGASVPTGTAAASATSAWNNTTQIALQNYGTGSANNATFKIGTNYIVVVVDNTNSITGSSTSTVLNPSGLLVYETSAAEINGRKVPEVATWLPILGAVACYGLVVLRRRKPRPRAIRA